MRANIYAENETPASQILADNYVTVAQAASPKLFLTKHNYANGNQRPYDNVKYFNFFEVPIWNLYDLYLLSKRMLAKPRCCYIRARVKDETKTRNVVRRYKGDDATLILQNLNWFALDVDTFSNPISKSMLDDIEEGEIRELQAYSSEIMLRLPYCFRMAQCFFIASASFGIKPGIRMRMFFWADQPCSNYDLKRLLHGNKAGVDLALFDPIQPIYTAAPIFHGMEDPVKKRIAWYDYHGIPNQTVQVPIETVNHRGAPEKLYTKKQALRIREVKLIELTSLPHGDRHNGLRSIAYLLGKLIEQQLIDENETIDLTMDACDYWPGHRNTKKDMETLLYGIEVGKQSMGKE